MLAMKVSWIFNDFIQGQLMASWQIVLVISFAATLLSLL